jgi:hypothetical protein
MHIFCFKICFFLKASFLCPRKPTPSNVFLRNRFAKLVALNLPKRLSIRHYSWLNP